MAAVDTRPPVPIRWLQRLYEPHDHGWVTVFALDRAGRRHTLWAPVHNLTSLAAPLASLADSADIWFGVATRREQLASGRRGGETDCEQLAALWVDVDIAGPAHAALGLPADLETARKLLDAFPLPPTAVVASGHGLQAWWLLSDPLDTETARLMLGRWAATWQRHAHTAGVHLDNVWDLPRVMRLPGTINIKTDPVPVTLTEARWERRYTPDDIDQWLDDPAPLPTPTGAHVPYIGPTRPGDAYNAAHSGTDTLAAAGWTHGRTDRNGDQHWVRPGKDRRQGTGATVYADDGHTTIWSDAPGVPVRRPFDPFGLHTFLHHGGDWSKASEDLAARGYGTRPTPDDLTWVVTGTATTVGEEQAGGEEHGWERIDLAPFLDGTHKPVTPNIWPRSDGQYLFYTGRINDLHGASGSGKSMVAHGICAWGLGTGLTISYIDWEDHAANVVNRLLEMGVDPDAIRERFIYRHPTQTATLPALMELEAEVRAGSAVVVIDSTGESMAMEQLNQDKDPEVLRWMNMLPRRCANAGACVVMIDHVIKDPESRGLWAIGSQRKMGAIDGVTYRVDAVKPFARGTSGTVKLVTAKDRNGTFARGATAAEIDITSRPPSLSVVAKVPMSAALEDGSGGVIHTVLAERISRWLEIQPSPQSSNTIEKTVPGNAGAKRTALLELVENGYVEVAGNRNGGDLYRSARSFREDEITDMLSNEITSPNTEIPCSPRDPTSSTTSSNKTAGQGQPRPTSSNLVQPGGNQPRPTSSNSPPTGGTTVDEVPRPIHPLPDNPHDDAHLFADNPGQATETP